LKILLTSTSFQDSLGKHHDALDATGYDVTTLRGPLKKEVLLPIIADYDGVICGDDYYTRDVINNGKRGKLKIISKFGIGLDKINLEAAKELGVIVTNCPGSNHITVAEHTMALMLAFYKNIPSEITYTRASLWERMIGNEIHGKYIGIAGMGRIGKEIALRAQAFGMKIFFYDNYIDKEFVNLNKVNICHSLEELVSQVDILSLNMSLNNDNRYCINKHIITHHVKRGLLLINTARGELVDEDAIIFGLDNQILCGYLTDVLENEPMDENHPFTKYENIMITPHIGSRTYQSVERQGIIAVDNLYNHLI